MKSIYYKRLIADRMELSASERILYSNLVYDAICNYDDTWDKETGEFDAVNLIDVETIPLTMSTACNHLSVKIQTSKVKAWQSIRKLKEMNIIDDGDIRLNDIHTNGYFTLMTESGLKGELLIFYSWLLDLSKWRRVVFCNRKKLSELYCVNENDIKYYLKELKKRGFIERDEHNHLIIK